MKNIRKFLPIFAVMLAFAISLSVVNAQVEPMGANGTLSVTFGGTAFVAGINTSALSELIQTAEGERDITLQSTVNGTDISQDRLWVTPTVFTTFNDAITAAKNFLNGIPGLNIAGTVKPGDTFTMTLRIEGNTGFAGMGATVSIPEGLELTAINYDGLGNLSAALPESFPVVGSNATGQGNAIVTISGAENNVVVAANLLVYTFRVPEGTTPGITEPITFAFANIYGPTPPVNADGAARVITLPGNNGNLGRINIVE
ncbi:MAG: hypothetical protein FWE27_06950 [Defluviitaleaceae bacterium]|nr:hypothetical protein [Defluviitaleaceae bacterium]